MAKIRLNRRIRYPSYFAPMDSVQPQSEFPSLESWEIQLASNHPTLENWLQPTWDQLNKDLAPYVELDKPENWLEALKRAERGLHQVLAASVEHFHQVMYRIDLPEKRSASLLSQQDLENRMLELAKLVLWREYQKIWIRRNWSI